MRWLTLTACLACVGCTTGHTQSILRGASDAVGALAAIEGVQPQDVVAMQTALDSAADVAHDPERADFWVGAFLSVADSVVASLEAHDIDVPPWVMTSLRMVGALCRSVCQLIAPQPTVPDM